MRIEPPDDVRGDGFVLRPLVAADAPAYVRAFAADPRLGRLLGIEEDPDEAEFHGRIALFDELAQAGRAIDLTIADPATDAFLGEMTLHAFEWRHRRCEIGFWIVPEARGQGLGARAVARTVSWAFGTLDLLRVELTTTPDNEPVHALAYRLGFEREGVLRRRNVERGNRVDIVYFGILRDEWGSR